MEDNLNVSSQESLDYDELLPWNTPENESSQAVFDMKQMLQSIMIEDEAKARESFNQSQIDKLLQIYQYGNAKIFVSDISDALERVGNIKGFNVITLKACITNHSGNKLKSYLYRHHRLFDKYLEDVVLSKTRAS